VNRARERSAAAVAGGAMQVAEAAKFSAAWAQRKFTVRLQSLVLGFGASAGVLSCLSG
jgi:hypothetical protein